MSEFVKGAPILDYDFVYESNNSAGFCNVRIKLNVKGSQLELVIESENLPDVNELSEILNAVRRDNLQKLKLNIWDDFEILVKANGETYRVLTDSETKDAIGVEQV